MVFSTPVFLTLFLPLVLAGAWFLCGLLKGVGAATGRAFSWAPVNGFLLLSSLFFYFWGEGWGVCWLVGSAVFNALCARAVARWPAPRAKNSFLALAIVGNLAFLAWFKYAAFIARSANFLPGVHLPVPEVALPLGISFYTFQAMSYVVDVYRGEVPPARRWSDFACYLTFFPQLVAGPIVRYADVAEMLASRTPRFAQFASGWKRFLCGLAKKVLVANSVAEFADAAWSVLAGGSGLPPALAWTASAAYALQIYYDFSGYSDMAIGLGRMFGFEFKENFLHPYTATSIRDFWRKWHISLSSWFRDYLYIPLGGNRRGRARAIFNSFVVFALCGLWHGASAMFILWGLWHGLFLMLERLLPRRDPDAPPAAPLLRLFRSLLARAYALAVILAGWVLFRSDSLSQAGLMLRSWFGRAPVAREARILWLDLSPKVLLAMAAGLLLAFPVAALLRRFARRAFSRFPAAAELAEWAVLTAFALLAMLMLAGGAYNPFIYFRF